MSCSNSWSAGACGKHHLSLLYPPARHLPALVVVSHLRDAAFLILFYGQVRREHDDKIVHYCRASKECLNKKRAFEKRIDMSRHLLAVHGIQVNIPKQFIGRPKDANRIVGTSSRGARQSQTRFSNIELRVKNARKKHEHDILQKATLAWMKIEDKRDLTYETWLESYKSAEMEKWEKKMPHRLFLMKTKIEKAYEAWKRGIPATIEGPSEEGVEQIKSKHAS